MRFPVLFAILNLASALSGACRQKSGTAGTSRDATTADAPPLVETKAERGTEIALLYASNLQGEYEHCGCPSHPLGGLVRRATVIDQARADADGVLIVDAGDMLLPATFHHATLQPPEPSEVARRARLILAAYARMGVHAVLPAERDLVVGPAKLKRLLTSLGVRAVASNLFDAVGHPVFDRDRIVTIAGVAIGIFGVVRPQPEDQAEWQRWRIHATDPTAAARDEVASLKARGAKMIVALLHLGPAGAAEKLLTDVPGITWAVQGHAGAQLETPITVGGARLVEAMALGKLSGRLDIHVVDGTASFSDRGERAQVLTIIADHRRQLADIEKRAAEDKTDQLRDYYRLRREGIGAAITRETALARTLPAVVRGSWYENRIIPLDESIPDQRAITLLVTAYNAESTRRATAGLPVGIAMRNPTVAAGLASPTGVTLGATSDQPTRYAGSAACAPLPPAGLAGFPGHQACPRPGCAVAYQTRPGSDLRGVSLNGLSVARRHPQHPRGHRPAEKRRLRILPRSQSRPRGRSQQEGDHASQSRRNGLQGVPHAGPDQRRVRIQDLRQSGHRPRTRRVNSRVAPTPTPVL